jgi:NitT/TauT family transport system substrate-binding protein
MLRRRAFIAGSAAFGLSVRAVAAQTVPALRIGYSPVGWTLGEGYLSDHGGFFKRAGLTVEMTNLINGGAINAGVIGGALDIGATNVGSIASAHARGFPVALIAPSIVSTAGRRPMTAVSVLASSNIRQPRDLTGKTICVSAVRDLQQASIMNWLEQSGIDPQSVKFIEVPIPQMLSTLRAGRVDAASLAEPWLTAGGTDVRVLGAPYDTLAPEIMLSGWVATRASIAANGPTLKRFVEAIAATAAWGNSNPAAALKMVEDMSGLSPELAERMARPTLGERLVASQIQPIIDTTAKYGFLPRTFSAEEIIATV